jgi:hypothetical protein
MKSVRDMHEAGLVSYTRNVTGEDVKLYGNRFAIRNVFLFSIELRII